MLTSEHELEKVVQLIHNHTDEVTFFERFFSRLVQMFSHTQDPMDYEIGAIIETPRACLCADKIAKTVRSPSVCPLTFTRLESHLFSFQLTNSLNLSLASRSRAHLFIFFIFISPRHGSGKLISTYIKEGIIHKGCLASDCVVNGTSRPFQETRSKWGWCNASNGTWITSVFLIFLSVSVF
jgi:hypothetical protein